MILIVKRSHTQLLIIYVTLRQHLLLLFGRAYYLSTARLLLLHLFMVPVVFIIL